MFGFNLNLAAILGGLLALAVAATVVQQWRISGLNEKVGTLTTERDAANDRADASDAKRAALAGDVSAKLDEIREVQQASNALQADLVKQLRESDEAARLAAEAADAQRRLEREQGREIRTFDTRGVY